jgi:hypothetical protein
MKTVFLCQYTNINNSELEHLVNGLKATNTKWFGFGRIPCTNEITALDDKVDEILESDRVVVHGGTKILEMPRSLGEVANPNEYLKSVFPNLPIEKANCLYQKFVNGIFYSSPDKFDQAVYAPFFKKTLPRILLNEDASVHALSEVLDTKIEYSFIKPTTDDKEFSGGIIENQTVREYIDGVFHRENILERDPTIMLAPVQLKPRYEWRFFVVNGFLVTASQYMKNGVVSPDKNIPDDVWEAAFWYSQYWIPDTAFAMDMCLTHDNIFKIVEYNCINCSGLYNCDTEAYVKAFL